jgi:hypothetical protein
LKRAQKSQVFVLDIQVTRPFIFFIRLPQQHFSFVAPFSAFLFSKAGRSSSGSGETRRKWRLSRDQKLVEMEGKIMVVFFFFSFFPL